MDSACLSSLFPLLSERSKSAAISRLGFANVPLRRHLADLFDRPYGQPGAFLADPALEAVFGWQAADVTMEQLAREENLLHPDLVSAMDSPPGDLAREYRFARDLHPYTHQLESWRLLAREPRQSLVVTSGTGSGKTECFMVPILDRLVRQRDRNKGQLVGVRALFLYPLNALINSQRERLRAWTHGFGGDIRFCLYNGNTPETLPARSAKDCPCEVMDRKNLRASPPPILVTNPTMLEYMLVRTVDTPILEQSQGKLEWVVLDEAHTYVGSQAAEAALLIRRVLLAFGVQPEDVHFIATSATIGDPAGQAGRDLKTFLAQVAGVSMDRVHLVAGWRQIPEIGKRKKGKGKQTISDLEAIDPGLEVSKARYRALVSHPVARGIRSIFTNEPSGQHAIRLSRICRELFPGREQFDRGQQHEALRWLDLLSGTRKEAGNKGTSDSFLPLRIHLFHQTLGGIWACADPSCPEKKATSLDDPEWPFGVVYLEARKHCTCGSPAYEVVRCGDCGAVYLLAEEDKGLLTHVQPLTIVDEFELEVETGEEAEEAPSDRFDDARPRVLIVNRSLNHTGLLVIDRKSRRMDEQGENTLRLQVQEDAGDGLCCPACEQQEGQKKGILFRTSRLGAPFLLGTILPTLLEFAPDAQKKPADHPWRGRRLLTFNDSRQGTARMAIRLQQEAERNTMRGLVYHHALQYGAAGGHEGARELARELADLEKAHAVTPNATLQRMIEEKKERLARAGRPVPIKFRELAGRIAREGKDFDKMVAAYRDFAPGVFGGDTGREELARMLLVREFGRRPKFLNNLETMGMVAVSYPDVDTIRNVPDMVNQAAGFALDSWRDFLKICLDFFVRAGGSLEITPAWRQWMGLPFRQSWLLRPDAAEAGRNQRRWPKARRSGMRATLVRLLAHVLQVDISTAEGEDRVDAVLQAAWDILVEKRILQLRADGYILPLERLAFVPMNRAWVCPVTRRLLDTTLSGVTPYLPEKKATDATSRCREVQVPVYEQPFGGTPDVEERIAQGRKWLREQSQLAELREQGLWSDHNDRVVELSPYFRTAEHSAQIEAKVLARYEREFKSGDINLLSCSTTMEMGIDIGGISLVAMNNVPPHPANYFQRAGRAGRRKEARSLALTLCKANPLDQAVFANSLWAFETSLAPPGVSLDSPIIIQRHVQSFLLTRFLAEKAGGKVEQVKLNCGFFFLGEDPWVGQYCAWCEDFSPESDPELAEGLRQLVRYSVLQDHDLCQRTCLAAASMKDLSERWRREWRILEEERQEFVRIAGENAPASKAITYRLKRLTDEYLLRELATQGYLPAYGFPAHIAAFDNLTVDRFKKRMANRENGREDNRYQRRDLASRDLATALREYAPGAEVVMDGLVYRSAGVTLNWHVPPDAEQVREIQEIRYAWRCGHCGASGSSPSLRLAMECSFCGKEIDRKNILEFLEPAGFAVDFYSSPGNDITVQQFVPVETPWVNAEGDWHPLPSPRLGRVRTTTMGHVFHHSKGIHGTGYALCLVCGRAEPMTPNGELPKMFERPHKKLRRAKDEDIYCPATDWKIKQGVSLGHDLHTDMVEFQLKNRDGVWLNDLDAARTMAVALRDSLAELIGVQATELGCEVKQAQPESGVVCHSIVLYDHFAAGYASRAGNWLVDLFKHAIGKLSCPMECESACPHCLLDFDQRFAADSLNRHAALAWFDQVWLNSLALPEQFACFGTSSVPEYRKISEAIRSAINRNGATGVRLYTGSAVDSWDVSMSRVRMLAYGLAGQGVNVEIVLPGTAIDDLDVIDRHLLAGMAQHPGITFFSLGTTPRVNRGYLLAETIGGNVRSRWACGEKSALCCGPAWGSCLHDGDLLVRGDDRERDTALQNVLEPDDLRPVSRGGNDCILEIHGELNGPVQGFGNRFWGYIMDNHAASRKMLTGTARIASIRYTDRYLKSPWTIVLLTELFRGLLDTVGQERWPDGTVTCVTMTINKRWHANLPHQVWHDWQNTRTRAEVLKQLFASRGIAVSLNEKERRYVEHRRAMIIKWLTGEEIHVILDQGVSYWQPQGVTRFDFSVLSAKQAGFLTDMMANKKCMVTSSDIFATNIALQHKEAS